MSSSSTGQRINGGQIQKPGIKLGIVGIGKVGSTLAYTVALKGLCSELVLVNRSPEPAVGDMHDLRHSMPFLDKQMEIQAGQIEDLEGADIVALCQSVPMKPGFSDRNSLALENVRLFRRLIPQISQVAPNAILLILSNPVDVLTYVSIKQSGFPANRVIGTGTFIDSARFRSLLSEQLGIHPDDLRAYILGEHGDTQFPLMSQARAAGELIEDNEDRRELFKQAVYGGFQVFTSKGYTNYAVSLAAATMIESIVFDMRRTFAASVLIDDYYGVNDVCLSVPVVLGRDGVQRSLRPDMLEDEQALFRLSAKTVRDVFDQTWGE